MMCNGEVTGRAAGTAVTQRRPLGRVSGRAERQYSDASACSLSFRIHGWVSWTARKTLDVERGVIRALHGFQSKHWHEVVLDELWLSQAWLPRLHNAIRVRALRRGSLYHIDCGCGCSFRYHQVVIKFDGTLAIR